MRKSWHSATANRGAETDSACTVYTVKIFRAVPKNSGTRTKVLAVPCPKRYSVNGVEHLSKKNKENIIKSYKIILVYLKPAAHEWKQVSKWPGKAVFSAVSSRVRLSFRENFATQGREENICHV